MCWAPFEAGSVSSASLDGLPDDTSDASHTCTRTREAVYVQPMLCLQVVCCIVRVSELRFEACCVLPS